MFWYSSTVTLIYLIISGISRSLQIYIGKLSGENTIVIKNRFISAYLVSSQKLNGAVLHLIDEFAIQHIYSASIKR